MKKSKVILLCVVAVLVAAIIIGAVVFFRSPHYALSQMKKAISKEGISAIRPYLSESLQEKYDAVVNVSEKVGFLSGLLPDSVKSGAASLISGLAESGGEIQVDLKGITWSGSRANVSLNVSNDKVNANVELVMERIGGQWRITSASIPVGLS